MHDGQSLPASAKFTIHLHFSRRKLADWSAHNPILTSDVLRAAYRGIEF